jgi:hypothetical protein
MEKYRDFYVDSIDKNKYKLGRKKTINLNQLDCILFRKDPSC